MKKVAATIDSVQIPGKPVSSESEPAPQLKEQRAAFKALVAEQKRAATIARGEVPEDEPKAEPAPKVAAEAAEEPAKADPKPARDLERLRAKILLTGAPKAAVESLSEPQLREWWDGVEERERDRALTLQRASEAEKRLQETTSKKAEPERVPTAELDLDEMASELSDQFGEDEAGALLKALTKLVEPLRKENAEIRAVLNEARDRGVKTISQSNRDRLAKDNPALKNDKAWSLIEAHVLEAFKKEPTKYPSAEAAFDDVHEALYGELLSAPTVPGVSEAEGKARAKAAALTSPGAQKRDRKASPLDASYAAFKALKANPGDLDGAKLAYARALTPQ